MKAFASGEQLPGHGEVDPVPGIRQVRKSSSPMVRMPARRACCSTWGAAPQASARKARGRPSSSRGGQPGASLAGSAVGRYRHRAQMRGGSRAQRQVGEHLGAGRADERFVVVAEVVFEAAWARRSLVVGARPARAERRLAGVQVVVDGEEEFISGPYGCSDQDGAVGVRAEYLAAGLQLCPPFAERADADVAALDLDQPIHSLRFVPSPQVGQLPPRVLEGFAQGGDGTS